MRNYDDLENCTHRNEQKSKSSHWPFTQQGRSRGKNTWQPFDRMLITWKLWSQSAAAPLSPNSVGPLSQMDEVITSKKCWLHCFLSSQNLPQFEPSMPNLEVQWREFKEISNRFHSQPSQVGVWEYLIILLPAKGERPRRATETDCTPGGRLHSVCSDPPL